MPLVLLSTVAVAAADLSNLSPASEALVAAVARSIEAVRVKQAALPVPKNDAERIVRLGELDDAPREFVMKFDFSTIPAPERAEALSRVSALVDAVDRENEAALAKLVPSEGWFLRARYGAEAASAAFQIVQHGDLAFQERFLPALRRFAQTGEVPGPDYAMMYDRVEIQHDRPQLYGTQYRCDGGRWRPYPIRDFDGLEARRRKMRFLATFAQEKVTYWDVAPICPQTQRPPPRGMKVD